MIAFPGAPLAVLAGTNKLSSIWGTAFAFWRFGRSLKFDWRVLRWVLPAAFAASVFGAVVLSRLDTPRVKPYVVVVLIVVVIFVGAYTTLQKELGAYSKEHHLDLSLKAIIGRATVIGVGAGFYDGFFGPGTGSFLIFACILWLGFDFLQASGWAKAVNFATNTAALSFLLASGNFYLGTGLCMACANVAGSAIGSHLAILKGNGWIRFIFLIMVAALLVKLIITRS
ncbi:MAG: TSUP family transporter [Armatimonadetes bacterium]|nr:TSUP family transporter [Armatimonadota bacterium]